MPAFRFGVLLVSLFELACSASTQGGSSIAPTGSPTSSVSLGLASDTELAAPEDVAFDRAGRLYISEFEGNRVLRLDGDRFSVVAGTGSGGYAGDGGDATTAELWAPSGLAFDERGNLLIVDHHNACIRRVTAETIERLWGVCGETGFAGDGGPAAEALFDDPIGIEVDAAGRVWIADELNGRIRRVNTDGTIETIAGGGRLDPAIASPGSAGTRLAFSHTSYVALHPTGTVYFSDFFRNVVMRVDRRGRVTRIAGTGRAGAGGDRGPAVAAELAFPTGLAFDADGNLFISDADNHRICVVRTDGTIETVAGTGRSGFSGDGGPATGAELNAPAGLAFDAVGRLFIADQGNDVVRVVDLDGTIRTIAGVTP